MMFYLFALLTMCLTCSTASAQIILELSQDAIRPGTDQPVQALPGVVVVGNSSDSATTSTDGEQAPGPLNGSTASPVSNETTLTNSNGRNANVVGENVLRGKPVDLFDGESLDGWIRANGKESKNWVVQDGTLHRARRGGDLYHRDWYRDFDFSFEWKLEAGGNSGVKYRVQGYGNNGKKILGCEYQIQDDQGRKFDRYITGSLYDVYEPSHQAAVKIGEWNKARIIVCGYRVQHWVNGELVVDATFGDSDWYRRVDSSKFKKFNGFGLNREGRIFLQDHGNPVWFRNLTITPLDSSHTIR